MQFFNFNNPDKKQEKLTDLKNRVDTGSEVERMLKSPGWKHVEKLLGDQLKAYQADNAMNAADWNDYLRKAGKIFGIQLLFTDLEEFIRQGQDAAKEIDRLNH